MGQDSGKQLTEARDLSSEACDHTYQGQKKKELEFLNIQCMLPLILKELEYLSQVCPEKRKIIIH